MARPFDLVRLMEKIDKENGHWIWKGATSSQGYGNFRYEDHNITAQRAAWAICGNELPPDGQRLRNVCNRGALCVKPSHWVTPAGVRGMNAAPLPPHPGVRLANKSEPRRRPAFRHLT